MMHDATVANIQYKIVSQKGIICFISFQFLLLPMSEKLKQLDSTPKCILLIQYKLTDSESDGNEDEIFDDEDLSTVVTMGIATIEISEVMILHQDPVR